MRRPRSVSASNSTSTSALTRGFSRAFLLLTLLAFLTTVSSLPSLPADRNGIEPRASKPFLLRVMPLGASITVGYQSSDGTGYRKPLREQLRYAGWQVDMVGSLENGTMKDNQNEGHFGDTIDSIADASKGSMKMQPNVILINAGTNDGLQDVHVTDADDRMNSLIDGIFAAIPNTTVVLSTLIPNTHAQSVMNRINAEYRNVVARRRQNGDRLILAEMSYFISKDRLVDGTHPDDQGYREMAAVWWAAIQEAENEGFLQKPNGVTRTMAADLAGRNGTAEGMGLDDGPIEDPKLPAYSAPAQVGGDTGTDAAVSLRADSAVGWMFGFWLLFWQVIL
ncbi:SGNH hydrolase-type esterase domain-containing protein [Aspergillus unguis]